MYCNHCGAPISENAKFCTGCGKPLVSDSPDDTSTVQRPGNSQGDTAQEENRRNPEAQFWCFRDIGGGRELSIRDCQTDVFLNGDLIHIVQKEKHFLRARKSTEMQHSRAQLTAIHTAHTIAVESIPVIILGIVITLLCFTASNIFLGVACLVSLAFSVWTAFEKIITLQWKDGRRIKIPVSDSEPKDIDSFLHALTY